MYKFQITNYKSQTNSKLQFPKFQINKFWSLGIWSLVIIWNLVFGIWNLHYSSAQEQEEKKEPISIDAETVEYSTDNKFVTATGNVVVVYKGTKLTCSKLTVNTETKEGQAEGNVRLEDEKGVIECEKMEYNFQNKAGIMVDAQFRANPYFGKAEKVDKINDIEFIGLKTQMSTCSFDNPHYRIKTKKVDFFRGDKVQTKNSVFSLGQVRQIPILYMPRYNRSLKDPILHVQMMPGKSKDWGPYLLTAWRYNLTKYISGRIFFDYREKRGVAEGFGANYDTTKFGKGDFKYYYMQERPRNFLQDQPAEFQRYFIRLRHKWDIDEKTNLIGEYYKIEDSKRAVLGTEYNILKDYFPREYEKDTTPLSYILVHRLFNYSSLDFLVQKRTNRWHTQLEKLPEIKYTLPSSRIFGTRLYFENLSSFANYNQKNTSTSTPATNASTPDVHINRVDTTNKVSLPLRVAFFQLTPFISNQATYYSEGKEGVSVAPRIIFYAGSDISTKFYRIFNVKSGLFGLDINGLRHIITPTVKYSYNHTPTVPSSKLRSIDSIDSINTNNSLTLELSNKLQTKRNQQSVDLLDFRINNSYTFKSFANKAGGTLSNFVLYLDFLPYSWLTLRSDATFSRSEHKFSNANADLNFNFTSERSIGFGQRYTRRDSKELTFNTNWRINPKWKISVYERYQFGHGPNLSKGLREQQYTLSRDLHCWTAEITWNVTKSKGEAVWVVFRLKAFPELEFDFNQTYHQPKPGSQSLGTPIN